MQKLSRKFFDRCAVEVAKDLLGKVLVVGDCSGRINEVEAYKGSEDPASHAYLGITERNKPMFGKSGHFYVYFTYGMYHCLNIVTEIDKSPSAVLIRSIIPLSGIDIMQKRRGKDNNLTNGPGKLCIALDINKKKHNNLDICKNNDCYIYDDGFLPKHIKSSSRIGIKKGLEQKWRFFYDE